VNAVRAPQAHLYRARQSGFTYLWLLFALAVGAAGLAALGERASMAVQREREAELMFRGQQIAGAIAAYRAATAGPVPQLPAALKDLLDDRRSQRPLHHLRQLYADPFTGQSDWVLVTTEEGLIAGVHSRSDAPALRVLDLPVPEPGRRARVSDRVFMADGTSSAVAAQREPAPQAPP
jgi:type II secretory pathway pseudopilin PulG